MVIWVVLFFSYISPRTVERAVVQHLSLKLFPEIHFFSIHFYCVSLTLCVRRNCSAVFFFFHFVFELGKTLLYICMRCELIATLYTITTTVMKQFGVNSRHKMWNDGTNKKKMKKRKSIARLRRCRCERNCLCTLLLILTVFMN